MEVGARTGVVRVVAEEALVAETKGSWPDKM